MRPACERLRTLAFWRTLLRQMAEDDETRENDGADMEEDDLEDDGLEDADPEVVAAAKAIEFVVLPIACVNEGKGAPLAMGLQRWWAQELAARGAKAAAPVFTAMAEQAGKKRPALMVFREDWTDDRVLDGIQRFESARAGLVVNLAVTEEKLTCNSRLVDVKDGALQEAQTWKFEGPSEELPVHVFDVLADLAKRFGVELEHESWQQAFGTSNHRALISFLVGLGNLSALQGRCIPTTPDQLLSPFIDAINQDSGMDVAMQGLHMMVDVLVQNPFDQSAIPLALQALNVAAQKRKTDESAFHHLGLLFRRLGDAGSAVQALNNAFNIDPTNPAIANGLIETLRSAGDNANALKVAQFAAEKGNEDPVLFSHIGSLMIEDDQFDEAEPFLRRAVDEGKVPAAYGDLANVLWDRSDEEDDRGEALSLLRTAVGLDVVAKSTLDMLLDLHEEETLEDATMLLLEAADKHDKNAMVLRYVATMYLDGDDPPKARPYLEKILALPRRTLDHDAFARRGTLQLDIDNFDERYEEAVEQVRSDKPEAQAEAAQFLREIVAKEPRYWQPHLMLALAVRNTEGDSAALAHLMDAVRLRPNDIEIRNLIAAVLRKQGRPREAVDHLRAVVALNPRDVEPVVGLATCMRDANMFEEARQVCQAALQMLPDHPAFKSILGSLPPPKKDQN